mmetsp:Transcript_8680/g.25675  ORF Transcript_8680/g.25675 Transcript_8680/m.25675 type:complete len:259 (-) Transcript_8680:2932-3708(-)
MPRSGSIPTLPTSTCTDSSTPWSKKTKSAFRKSTCHRWPHSRHQPLSCCHRWKTATKTNPSPSMQRLERRHGWSARPTIRPATRSRWSPPRTYTRPCSPASNSPGTCCRRLSISRSTWPDTTFGCFLASTGVPLASPSTGTGAGTTPRWDRTRIRSGPRGDRSRRASTKTKPSTIRSGGTMTAGISIERTCWNWAATTSPSTPPPGVHTTQTQMQPSSPTTSASRATGKRPSGPSWTPLGEEGAERTRDLLAGFGLPS